MRRNVVTCICISLIVSLQSSCAAGEANNQPQVIIKVDIKNVNRLHFTVYGDPGLKSHPEIELLNLSGQNKIREGMRRFASDELNQRGLCLKGFTGPDGVWGEEANRLLSHFYVDCVP